MRRKEERRKQLRSNKQQGNATQHTQGRLYMYMYTVHVYNRNIKYHYRTCTVDNTCMGVGLSNPALVISPKISAGGKKHVHTCPYMYTCSYMSIHVHMLIHVHVHVHVCAYMRVCLTVVAEGLMEGGDWVGDGSALLCQINNCHIIHVRPAQPSKPHPCMSSYSSTAAFIILFVFMITGAPPISSPDVRYLCRGQCCHFHILLVEVLPDGRSSCNQRHK